MTFSDVTFAGIAGTNYTLTFTKTGGGGPALTPINAENVTVTPGAANLITVLTQPVAPTVSGGVLNTQPVVRIVDAQGNRVTTDN